MPRLQDKADNRQSASWFGSSAFAAVFGGLSHPEAIESHGEPRREPQVPIAVLLPAGFPVLLRSGACPRA